MNLQDHFEDVEWKQQDTLFLVGVLLWIALLLALTPAYGYLYRGDMPYYHAVEYAIRAALREGQWPLWNIYFSEPLLGNPESMSFYPTHALLRFLPIQAMLIADLIIHLWLMVAALYLMLREWGLSRIASAGASLMVGLSTLIMVRVISGHLTPLPTYPWGILALVFYRRLLHRYRLVDLLLTILSVTFIILSGHTQHSLTALLIPGLYFVYFVLTHWEWRQILRASGLGAVVGIVSAGLLAFQFLPTLEYFEQMIRSEGFTFQEAALFSLNIVYLFNFFTPFLPHHNTGGFHDQTFYTGLMTFGLFLAAWRFAPPRYRGLTRYLMLINLIVLLLALGENGPLFRFVFRLMPFFRAPGRFLQIWTFTAALLAGIGIEILLTDVKRRQQIVSMLWFSLVLILEVILLTAAYYAFLFPMEGTPLEQFSLLPLIAISLAISLVAGVTLLLQRHMSHYTWMRLFVGGLLLDSTLAAVFLMLWPTYLRLYPSYVAHYQPDSPYVCLHGQLDPAAVRLYQIPGGEKYEVILRIAAGMGIPGIQFYPANLKYQRDLLNLGLRGTDLMAASYQLSVSPPAQTGWLPVHTECGVTVWKASQVLPRIYAASDVRLVPDTREASLEAVQASDFDPRQTAVVSSLQGVDFPALPSTPLQYEASITEYSANEIRAIVETSQPALVVVAEPYYPGWRAAVDGNEVPIWRANHGLRGVMVDEGRHEIIMEYRPATFQLGWQISLATLALLVIGSVVYAVISRRAAGAALLPINGSA